MTAAFPGSTGGPTDDSAHNPERCKVVAYCDTIPMILGVPPSQPYTLTVTTSFEHLEGVNDLDIYYWQGIGENTRDQFDDKPVWTRMDRSATGSMPEERSFLDLPPTSETVHYVIVVLNWSGYSAYKVKGEISPNTLPANDRTPVPRQIADSNPKPAARGKPPAAAGVPTISEGDAAGPRFIEEHSRYGNLEELPPVANRDRDDSESERSRTFPMVAAIVLVALGGGVFAFRFIRSRSAS